MKSFKIINLPPQVKKKNIMDNKKCKFEFKKLSREMVAFIAFRKEKEYLEAIYNMAKEQNITELMICDIEELEKTLSEIAEYEQLKEENTLLKEKVRELERG